MQQLTEISLYTELSENDAYQVHLTGRSALQLPSPRALDCGMGVVEPIWIKLG